MDQPTGLWSTLSQSNLFRSVQTSIRQKLLLGMLAVAFIPLMLLGVAVFWSAERAITDKAVAQLETVRTIKGNQLRQYFQTLEGQAATFAENRMIVDAMKEFRTSFKTALEENDVSKSDIEKLRQQLEIEMRAISQD